MKVVLLLFVVACCYALPTPDDWEDYKTQFNKSYPDEAEEQMRKDLFVKNKAYVDEHNKKHAAGMVSYTLGVNQFSDWTDEERKKLSGGLAPPTTEKST
ncbi:unnamed protein product [Nezara viridula]|uniref:Cathepsin propeptide inhibitor domain-containing protein n=1 Tax=Nezara viridula TaxID=85310 RepID=A0A9P0HSF4_NEZVI|nr:unnamed protein product [Nezara viridula]CAH1408267.1 unnamed protein product [Nezara viridula]